MMAEEYTIPSHVQEFVASIGYPFPYNAMNPYISEWYKMLKAKGPFYDFNDTSSGAVLKMHRMSIHPAARVSDEWASLLLNDNTQFVCDDQACTDWLDSYFRRVKFKAKGQGLVKKAFALGTGAWAMWVDTANTAMQPRRYDARMVLPMSWDDDGVSECGFCTQVSAKGRKLDQLQMHMLMEDGYHIITKCWDEDGRPIVPDGIIEDLPMKTYEPTFAIVQPAIENTFVDLSPYGQSVYAEAIDTMKSVDLCYDAVFNEVDLAKLRVFIGDMLIDYTETDENGNTVNRKQPLPFGRDNVIFRKVQSNEDMIKEFAPDMRTESQVAALRVALKTMGDGCGFGMSYFDIDESGYVKTAKEVSSDNAAMLRNIRKHENLLEDSIAQICHAVIHCAREFLHVSLPDEGDIHVNFDDSIITDTEAEKAQDMAEIGTTLNAWEYRMKWYGEDEATAKAKVPGSTQTMPEFVE